MKTVVRLVLILMVTFLSISTVSALETPIGLPENGPGMEVAAVYLQPIEMETSPGAHAMRARADSDLHIEADIHGVEGNNYGFAAGEWIPYLTIKYTLVKLDTGKRIEGMMSPMVANDGPHYGDNVKMAGVGKYRLVMRIESPLGAGFGRHTDKETGVGPWFEPFELEWTFNYFGPGKKGGY